VLVTVPEEDDITVVLTLNTILVEFTFPTLSFAYKVKVDVPSTAVKVIFPDKVTFFPL